MNVFERLSQLFSSPGATHEKNAYCSFCRKHHGEVGPLIEGPGDVFICDTCARFATDVFEQERIRRQSSGSARLLLDQGRVRVNSPNENHVRDAIRLDTTSFGASEILITVCRGDLGEIALTLYRVYQVDVGPGEKDRQWCVNFGPVMGESSQYLEASGEEASTDEFVERTTSGVVSKIRRSCLIRDDDAYQVACYFLEHHKQHPEFTWRDSDDVLRTDQD